MVRFWSFILVLALVFLSEKVLAQCNIDNSTVTNVSCFGGSNGAIDVVLHGASGNVSYQWDNGATTQNLSGLISGVYSTTVTDDTGCVVNKSFTITQPDSLHLTAMISDVTIPGGSDGAINITVSDGTIPYSYQWSNSATTQDISNLSAATYTVTVHDGHVCSLIRHFNVTEPSCQIQVLPDAPSICEAGSGVQLVATAFGAAGFVWSPSAGLDVSTGAVVLATPGSTQTYTVTATNLSNCSASIEVTVSSIPSVNAVSNATYCNGADAAAINFSSQTPGAEFQWTSDANIGFGTSGNDNIPHFTAVNSTFNPVSATISVHAIANGCQGAESQFVITVNPTPIITQVSDYIFCDGDSVSGISFLSLPSSANFSWTSVKNVGFGFSGAGIIDSFVAKNLTVNIRNSKVTVSATANSCVSAPIVFNVEVDPSPEVEYVPDAVFCNGDHSTGINFNSNVSESEFNWMSTQNLGFGFSGLGNIPAFDAVNSSSIMIIDTVKVYVVANGCTGPDSAFVINIFPTPLFTSSNNIALCNGGVLNYTATSNVTTNFHWKKNSDNFGNDSLSSNTAIIYDTLHNNSDNPINVKYIFTLSPGGNCSGHDTLVVTVNPTPHLSSSLNDATCDSVPFVYLAQSLTPGTTFSWHRDAVSGISNGDSSATGSLINETLNNITNIDVTVNYAVNLSANGCDSTIEYVSVTVRATPKLSDSILHYSICNNSFFSESFFSSTPGTTFHWRRDSIPGILPATNSGSNSISEQLINTTLNPITTFYIVTLTNQGCQNIQLIYVTVNPTPELTSDSELTTCDSALFVYQATSSTPGVSFEWIRNTFDSISNLADTGYSSLISEALNNIYDVPVTVNYSLYLTIDTCVYVHTVHVKVNPTPEVDFVPNMTFCNGAAVPGISFTGNIPAATYYWTCSEDVGFGLADSNDIVPFTAANSGNQVKVVTVNVFSKADNCVGPVQSFTITVYPTPQLSSAKDTTICDSVAFVYNATSEAPGTTFSWSRNFNPKINNPAASGSTNLINETLVNNSSTDTAVVKYFFTLTIDSACTHSDTLIVTVNPSPKLSTTTDTSVCSGAPFNYVASATTDSTTYEWVRHSVAGTSNSADSAFNGFIVETLENITNNTIIPVYYNFILTYINNGVTCESHQNLKVNVLPSPPSPLFTSTLPNDSFIHICGGSENINFNVDQDASATGVTYHWSADPSDSVVVRNLTNPNTVISFGNIHDTIRILVIANSDSVLGSCPDSAWQYVIISPDLNSIVLRKIILKQPGNLLVYPDNTMTADIGYRWGYDLKINDTTLGPPNYIPNQNYQIFVPDKIYLTTAQTELDTFNYCFWVVLRRGDCRSKVYYNGPYAEKRETENISPEQMGLSVYPNPASGNFNINLSGNIYGSIELKIYNTLSEMLYETSFTKDKYESDFEVSKVNFPNGIYYLELKSASNQKFTSKIMITN